VPTVKKTGLGRGFDSLIPQEVDTSLLLEDHERIEKIPLNSLSPNPHQPRTGFDEQALAGLAESIKAHGILQPLIVTPDGQGKYFIVAGERRWRAAKIAGEAKVPAIVRTTKEIEKQEIALVENMQRVDLSLLEQAVSIERLHQQFNMSYVEIGKKLGKADTTLINVVRLLQLPAKAREALAQGKMYEGHARAILALRKWPDKQDELLNNILQRGWNIRQAEQFAVTIKGGFDDKKTSKERMNTQNPHTQRLSRKLGGADVQIRRMAKGGRLVIGFKTDEQLEKIFEVLG
jgi:ParB family chromosome partitioning protein